MSVKYSAGFYKTGELVYISHLDLMKLFRRAIRRAGWPFSLTKGFTPRVRISIPQALKLGRESEREQMSFWLSEERDPGELEKSLNRQLPEGVGVFEIKKAQI